MLKVPANNNDDLTDDNSQLFKYKAAPARKTTDGVNYTNSSVKKHGNCCFIKVCKQLLNIVINAINHLQSSSLIKLD